MWRFIWRQLSRRPLRNGLAVGGVAVALALLASLSAFGRGYQRTLESELRRMGVQLLLVPLGCPYDAAARVLTGQPIETSLPDTVLQAARQDPDVALAAPLLIAAVTRTGTARADVWVGVDETSRSLKPWWAAKSGASWFRGTNEAILGAESAEVEMRVVGDKLFSPETGWSFRVAGVLERSGTSDDQLFFVPLTTAQAMFGQTGRLSAVAIRLHDPAALRRVSERLQAIPGAQVVTMTEMMGSFLNLVGGVRTLSRAIGLIALTVSILSVLNTTLATVTERAGELAVMRALGASRGQIFRWLALEVMLLTGVGGALGVGLVIATGVFVEDIIRGWIPFAPPVSLLDLSWPMMLECVLLGLVIGLVASCYPAWRASLIQPARALRDP